MISKDCILDLLNGDDVSETVLKKLNRYITEVAIVSVFDSDGLLIKRVVDEDLYQEISINLIQSLPNLRKKLERHLNINDEFLIKF